MLVGILFGAGGLIGWMNYRLAKSRQPVTLRLDEAQIEVHQATAHKITVEGLILSAKELRADNEQLRQDVKYWRERAEKAERRPLEEMLPPRPGNGKGS